MQQSHKSTAGITRREVGEMKCLSSSFSLQMIPLGKVLSHNEYIAQGHIEAEWDVYAAEQNRLSRERGQKQIIELWAGEGVGGNDIVNLFRRIGIEIPQNILKGLQRDDTVVSKTSVTGRGMNRREASEIYKWVSEQLASTPAQWQHRAGGGS